MTIIRELLCGATCIKRVAVRNNFYGGVKVSTGFRIDTSACPGSDGLVKNRKLITAKSNVINAAHRFARPEPMALAA